jgi:PhzF family phenazine biosynthesis protein
MNIPYFHVDALTDHVFAGNPAGVCLLESWPGDSLLQKIAAENNLSETAFVALSGEHYELRWFSPLMEIDLCAHATLAAAFALSLGNSRNPLFRFATQSGILTVRKQDDLFIMDFPARPASACAIPEELVQGLGLMPDKVLKARHFLAVFDHEKQVADLSPNFAMLATLDCLGIIVTAPGAQVDFVSRFFAPGAGIPEDPVTGSSHCTLIPYWAEQTEKQRLLARQLSSRGEEIICENKGERVHIGGQAVLYHSGTLSV